MRFSEESPEMAARRGDVALARASGAAAAGGSCAERAPEAVQTPGQARSGRRGRGRGTGLPARTLTRTLAEAFAGTTLRARLAARPLSASSVGGIVYAAAAMLGLVPLLTHNFYYLRVGGTVGLYLILAIGLNIVAGEAGLLDLGYVAFYGIGAYVYAFLSSPHFGLHVPFILSAACSIAAAVVAALAVSLPTLHLRGDYLAMVTLGFGQIVRILLNNLDRPVNITNGPNGIVGIDPPDMFGMRLASLEASYCLIWAFAVGAAVVTGRILRSGIGRAWAALREDEVAAGCMGVDVPRYRVMAFLWGAGLAGLAGALFASWQGAVFPQNFTMAETITVYCMIILGGLCSLPGLVMGAASLVVLPELLRAYSVYRMLIYGIALVLLVVYRPGGLIPAASVATVGTARVRVPSGGRGRRQRGREAAVGTAQGPAQGQAQASPRIIPVADAADKEPEPEPEPELAAQAGHIRRPSPALMRVAQPHPAREAAIGAATVQPALEVRDVHCVFGGLAALSGVSLVARRGEVVGIIGPNGAGKTTLFNLITGVTRPSSGDVMVFGRSVVGLPPHKVAALGVARTFQNIRLFEGQSVLENVLAGCHLGSRRDLAAVVLRTRAFKSREASAVACARDALRFLGRGLAEREGEPARDLSYPHRRRVELARAIAAKPRILLLDEPTAGMTPDEIGDVVSTIKQLKEHGYTVIVIEHHMDVVAETCDRVIVLDHGEKIAEGTPGEVASNRDVMRAYLGTEQGAAVGLPQSQQTARPPSEGAETPPTSHCQGILLGAPSPSATLVTRQPLESKQGLTNSHSGEGGQVLLEARGVHSSYGAVKVLQGVDLHVQRGEIVTVLGSNAAGKSTLLRTILGRVRPPTGEIRFMGRRIDGMPASEIARAGIALVPEGRRIFPGLSVLENLELGGYVLGDRREVAERIKEVLELFPVLAERRHQKAGTLSGGEQQMLAISRALIANPKLICMDEPSMGLAPVLVDKVMQTIQDIRRAGTTVLLVEQNARAALAIADRAYVLRAGRIVASGPAGGFLKDETIREAYLS